MAIVYTVEYQKSGLPHAHILLFLHHDDKHPTAAEIDRIISAEIPDLNEEPLVYEAVKQYMIHGPCGSINSRAGCMIEKKCTKHFLNFFFRKPLLMKMASQYIEEGIMEDLLKEMKSNLIIDL